MKCKCAIQEFDMAIEKEWTGRVVIRVWCALCGMFNERLPIRIIKDPELLLLKEKSVKLSIGDPFKTEFEV